MCIIYRGNLTILVEVTVPIKCQHQLRVTFFETPIARVAYCMETRLSSRKLLVVIVRIAQAQPHADQPRRSRDTAAV